jgi:hypothetical protein
VEGAPARGGQLQRGAAVNTPVAPKASSSDVLLPVAWFYYDKSEVTWFHVADNQDTADVLNKSTAGCEPLYSKACVDALSARVAELEKDAARLDWLDAQAIRTMRGGNLWRKWELYTAWLAADIRSVIDHNAALTSHQRVET